MSDKEQVFPSRANCTAYKVKIIQANKGLALIKRKRDAIEIQLKVLTEKKTKLGSQVSQMMTSAVMSLIESKLSGIDFKSFMVAPSTKASTYCIVGKTRIMGSILPNFSLEMNENENIAMLGLGGGAISVKEAKHKFEEILRLLMFIGSVELSIQILTKIRQEVSMRVSVMEFVIIPNMKKTLDYMENELEEREREDFFRLKRTKQRFARQMAEKKRIAELLNARTILDGPACSCNVRQVRRRRNTEPQEKGVQTS